MTRIALLSLTVAAGLAAQSNTVPGLDGRLTVIDDLTYWGRRGAAYPNGQVGLSMLNTMCNPGSVNIPWAAAMQSNHPMFGFQLVRVLNDRIEQINDWSFVKHAFTSTNFSGACGTCQNPGTGSLMGINCSDTYGSGNNGDRVWLGPPSEVNAWLGTWNPVGSYFDIGDPAQAGYPAAADGVRSLSQSVFDVVRNRMTVNETDLLTPGSVYFYGIQLIHRGEAVANRGDNLASRGTNPSYDTVSGTWSFPNSSAQTYGSILNRWPGATVDVGQNGNDDGRFFVASKATAIGGGNYHYEYAVHNVDNNRGGATLRIPIDAGAIASNFTFGDIDSNPLNDWTAARVGNEIVFTAPGNNPQNWNTIFNFGFDANFAPGNGAVQIDEARVGPGALFVTIGAKTPSGSTFAQANAVGTGCGGTPGCPTSFYEESFDLANSGYTLALNAGSYTVGSLTGSWIAPAGTSLPAGDDVGSLQALPFSLPFPGGSTNNLWVCSNGFVSSANNGTSFQPSPGDLLSGQRTWAALWRDLNPGANTMRFDANAQRAVVTFNAVPNYSGGGTVTFQWQFWATGTVHVIYQAVAGSTETLVGYSPGGASADPGPVDISAVLAGGLPLCSTPVPPTPSLALAASGRPVLGTSIQLVTSNIPAGSLLGLSILSLNPLPGIDLTSIGMNGCFLYAGLDAVTNFATPGTSASVPWSLPNTPSLSGTVIASQSATLTVGLNPFGFITSNGVTFVLGVL
ncbi:MAG: hypothetical protein MUC36_15465 [Planctomycetes bacterium]|jgi:hypothetical protein|nr:hypothetical protein [Planctomycetota bacterium]